MRVRGALCECRVGAQMGDDKLYMLDAGKKTYVPVDAELLARINSGDVRL